MKTDPTKILLAGEGGQGVQLIGQILAYAAEKDGRYASYIPNFGVEQRGGISLAYVKISRSPITYPKFRYADILIVLSDRAIKRTQNYIDDNTIYIYDDSLVHNATIPVIDREHKKGPLKHSTREIIKKLINIPAGRIVKKNLDPRTFNFIILGALLAIIGEITEEKVEDVVDEQLAEKLKKQREIYELDLAALHLGIKLILENAQVLKEKHEAKDLKFSKGFEGPTAKITHYPIVCKSCGMCEAKCPVKAIHMSTRDLAAYGGPVPEWDMFKCIACEKCAHICPDNAINVEVKEKGRK